MKKTIIITIAMLCVFGAVVMFGADRVSNDWQQPQQDETNIEVKPVIDKVEEEIASYPYNSESEFSNVTEAMVSPQEIVYIGGTIFEYFWEDLDMKSCKANVFYDRSLKTKNGPLYDYWIEYSDEDGYTNIRGFIDEYTGELLYVRREEPDFWGETVEMVDGVCVSDPHINDKAIDILLERTLKHTEKLGYANCVEYGVSRDTMGIVTDRYSGAAIYSIVMKTKENIILEFVYYDNMELDYPLHAFENVTKTHNDLENLPQFNPIPQ